MSCIDSSTLCNFLHAAALADRLCVVFLFDFVFLAAGLLVAFRSAVLLEGLY